MGKLLAKFLMWISGWKVDMTTPDEARRSVMIAAPHTSNWDAYFLKLAITILDIPMKVAIKDTWTKGIVGLFIRPMGGLGIDRSPKSGSKRQSQTSQMAAFYTKYDKIALVIAPEGTRKKRTRWKMGFYWIAKEAGVPITFGYLDYKNKIAGIGHKALYPSDDIASDITIINAFYKDIKGRNLENFSLDERYS